MKITLALIRVTDALNRGWAIFVTAKFCHLTMPFFVHIKAFLGQVHTYIHHKYQLLTNFEVHTIDYEESFSLVSIYGLSRIFYYISMSVCLTSAGKHFESTSKAASNDRHEPKTQTSQFELLSCSVFNML